jgi:beta propeller repeat protein
MESPHQVRAGAARTVLLSALIVLVACAVAAPAGAQRHSVRRSVGGMSYGMSWSVMGLTLFPRPTAAPGLRAPSVDGALIACQTGSAAPWPDQEGLSIRYKFRGGTSGVWSGAGDRWAPAVSDGLIAGIHDNLVEVFDPASGTAVTVSDTDAVYSTVAFSGSLVAWDDRRNSSPDIYARRFDRAAGQPTGDVFAICVAPDTQKNPAVGDDAGVWRGRRDGDWDIYAYDLDEGREYAVCAAPGDQTRPDVYGDTVVWQDSRRGQWDIYACDVATMEETAICTSRAAQVRPAVSSDLIVWQDYRPRYVQINDQPTRRYDTPLVYAYSRAAGETLREISGFHEGASQTSADVSGSLMVWEDDMPPTLPKGARRIAGGLLSDLWVYGYSLSPDTFYVRSPDLTFSFDVRVCPNPPVSEVGYSFEDWDSWLGDYTWQPFASSVAVRLPGGDGRKTYMVSFKDSAGKTPGGSGSEVVLDTHGPSCWAPYAATARSGGYATLRYKVTDKLSPEAKVLVTITRADGSVVRTLPKQRIATGKLVERRVSADLLRGVYAFNVSATDLAGNPQVRIGSNRLTVR